MTDLDRLISLLDKHQRAITIGAAIWFWTGVAVYARFLALPDLPQFVKDAVFWTSVPANAIWWGFLRPRIDARREELASKGTPDEP